MTHDHPRHAPAGHPNAVHAGHGEYLPEPEPSWDNLVVAGSPVEPQPAQPALPAGAHAMPSGHWVVTADPRVLTRGDRKELMRSVRSIDNPRDAGLEMVEQLLTRLVTDWSYPWPVPSVDRAAMDRVPLEDDDALMELVVPAQRLLFPGPVTPDDHADPESPTPPSGE